MVKGSNVFFKAIGSIEWFFTNTSLLSKDQLFKTLYQNPGLKISCVEDRSAEMNQLFMLGLFGLGMVKSLDYMQGKENQDIPKAITMAPKTKFSDIYGMNDTKEKMQQIIDYLEDPTKFKANGSRLRKGVLLYGPPGTGKTLLAKAIAGESGSAFIYRSASEFLEVYVGVGPSRVRKLFEEAKTYKSCIIFIDEIDAIGARAKNQVNGSGGY